MINELITKTRLSQYEHSPRISTIADELGDVIFFDPYFKQFYDTVFNIDTARGFGLDILGKIIGIGRSVNIPIDSAQVFGFSAGFFPFNQRPFSGLKAGNNSWLLDDNQYIRILKAKAYSNIIPATIFNANRFLKLFFSGEAHVEIAGIMHWEYAFNFKLNSLDRYIINSTTAFPRPCGVQITVRELP